MLPGEYLQNFELPDYEGHLHKVALQPYDKGLLILFLCNHCPYVHHYAERIRSLVSEYSKEGIRVYGINSNDASRYPEDGIENMPEMAKKLGLRDHYLRDESQSVAHAFKAERTPEAFLFNSMGKLVYRGAIDDQAQNPRLVKNRYLEEALRAVVNNDIIQQEYEPPVGCSIKWKLK